MNTDGSATAFGAVLYQGDKVVGIFSRKLSVSQRNNTTTERELLAIIEALEYFRSMIYGLELKIRTDHVNLLHNPDLASSRVQRWKLLLEEYGAELIYEPGETNQVADMLSRCISVRTIDWKESLKQKILAAQKTLNPSLRDLQMDTKGRVSVPENIASEITQALLDYLGNPGISTFNKTASKFFSIPTLKQRIIGCKSQCALCQRYQIGKANYGTLTVDLQTSEPFKHLASDIFGPVDSSKFLRNQRHQKFWILTILDRCSHWVNLSVLYDVQPKGVIRSVQAWINENGTPETLLSDQDRQYIASEFK
jgi:hypothetical protein